MLGDIAAPMTRLPLLLMLVASMASGQDSLRVASAEYGQPTTIAFEKEEDQLRNPSEDHRTAISDFWRAPVLTGDWNGGRTWMANHGLDLAGVFKADGFSNLHGGLERNGAYIHNIDITIGIDAEKLFDWSGGSLFVHVLSNNGGGLSQYVGDAQVVSNIEAARMTKLYQVWAQQEMWEGKVSFLAGVYDLNTEFYVTQTSGLFINSSHGIGKEFSQTGRNGPSIFPNPAAGLRLKLLFSPELYVQTVALDGMPGDPADLSRMAIHFNKEDGLLLTAEAGYALSDMETDNPELAKVAIGAWKYTSHFDDLMEVDENGNPVQCSDNWGIYLLTEKSIHQEPGSPAQGLAVFTRLGFASSWINEFDYHLGVGAVYTGLFVGRDEDQLGLALALAHNGHEFKNAMALADQDVKSVEATIEVTYKAQLTAWLALQPDVQYIIYPGTDPQLTNGLVVGSRLEISL